MTAEEKNLALADGYVFEAQMWDESAKCPDWNDDEYFHSELLRYHCEDCGRFTYAHGPENCRCDTCQRRQFDAMLERLNAAVAS